jgi:uncharacterized LabA/DUF88 family protein
VSKNVAVFVDVANIFYAAKAAGVDIDYVTLLKASSAGRDLVRAYAYTGLDPDNENQRNFHEFLRRHGYKVVSKDIRKYGDGKVKANLDIELVVDMMKTARNLDIAIVVSGDGDFAPAIRAVQEMGVRVEVVSFRGNTSSDLIEVADIFTDITQVAKVEKGSSRSGRRVATDDEDLSMTEVPDKQSEGTGEARGRGRGRTRTRIGEPAPVAATRTRSSRAVTPAIAAGDVPIVVLPGEKLSRVAASAPAGAARNGDAADEAATTEALDAADDEAADAMAAASGEVLDMSEEGQRRRRRRRGGRGRGRGRARDEAGAAEGTERAPERDRAPERASVEPDENDDSEPLAPPSRRPAASAFGSVWDSQIGIPAAATSGTRQPASTEDEEDFDEPPIPEYLISERRQRDAGRGRGPARGGRGGAYAAAMDRERFGGGRGSQISRFAEPAPRHDLEPNRNARPDRGGFRPGQGPAPRPAPRPAPQRAPSGDEPWSEVPPEIEAMLRAQMGGQASRPPRRDERPAMATERASAADAALAAGTAPASGAAPASEQASSPRRRTTRRPAGGLATVTEVAPEAAGSGPAAAAAPKRRATRSTRGTTGPAVTTGAADVETRAGDAPAAANAPRTTRARKTASTEAAGGVSAADGAEAAAPKRRASRKKAGPSA